jgi:RHS repeat-associated protein
MPCGASYTLGSVVWITAVPDPGSTFAGWGGGCLGPQVTCGVTLNGDRYTFAYFTKTPDTVATTYYHTDAIGSVRALSDQTGATVIRHDYRPFGEDTQPLAGDPMRFAGKELDPESALMNFEARYYRNTWGRFTQVDPIGGSLADPQSWNRYAYARNNPLRFVDPTGLSDTPVFHTLTDQAYREPIDMTNTWKSYDGLSLWTERLGMTASSGDLGPFGCGYTPDSNGNFYRWTETCDLHESQQIYFQAGGGTTKPPTTDTPTNTPTNPTPTPGPKESPTKQLTWWDRMGRCTEAQYGFGDGSVSAGLDLAKIASEIGATPIYKRLIGLPAIEGSSRFTNLFNYVTFKSGLGAKVKGAAMRTFTKAAFGSVRVGTVLGRANAIVGGALAVYDLTSIAICVGR